MGFDKNYPNRKDWRKQYTDSRRFDSSCKCHGGCPYCENNRTHFDKKKRTVADKELNDFKKGREE